jgi:hypothetical protein
MLKINSTDLAVIEDIIGIPYLSPVSGEGRVCFAGNMEIRPEFKENFSKKDVLAYILAYTHFEENNGKKLIPAVIKIQYPKDSISFWESISKVKPEDLLVLEEANSTVVFFK